MSTVADCWQNVNLSSVAHPQAGTGLTARTLDLEEKGEKPGDPGAAKVDLLQAVKDALGGSGCLLHHPTEDGGRH